MTAGVMKAIIPGMMDERFVKVKPISDSAGYPVSVYECPRCHLIELYHED
jgi:hypothetical protein